MFRLLLALLLLPLPAFAASKVALDRTTVEIFADRDPANGGKLTVGVSLTPKSGWHTYWETPGDAGLPPTPMWRLPTGGTATPFRFPVPETFTVSGLMNHVYARENVLLSTLTLPAPGPVIVDLKWLVCDDQLCVPEQATLTLGGPPQPNRIAAAEAALPRPLGAPARLSVANGRLVLAVPLPDPASVESAHFFVRGDGMLDFAAPQTVGVSDGMLRLETATTATSLDRVDGLLKLRLRGQPTPLGFDVVATPGPVPPPGAPLAAAEGVWRDALLALLAALAGGLVLNVMPCVFPILSLKALSLARAGGDERSARREALAYMAGVVLVCVALGATILGLRAAGSGIGWAFQLQDPRVVAFLLLLVLAIALNLAGLFELNVGGRGAGQALADKGGAAGAFWTGVLAAFVATPCTGPFMGVALGAAIVLPPAIGLAVFAGLGLGLALPFLLIGFVPALRRRLPKPGAWMDRLRRILSVPMFLTALGLAWVLGRQAGADGLTMALAAALLLGLALWWAGRAQLAGKPIWVALALVVAAFGSTVAVRGAPQAATSDAVLAAEPFSAARLAELRAAGKPVFVYFTADWCITCKVNERGALADADVTVAFASAGVTTLVGDWTRPDAAISAYLASQGRSGIPLYQFYGPDGRIQTLPQLLTPGMLAGLVAPGDSA
jgi:DsbC/DsbD-like thiol-disulfide interchange protein/cytochrome c biogenesis protein CcdA